MKQIIFSLLFSLCLLSPSISVAEGNEEIFNKIIEKSISNEECIHNVTSKAVGIMFACEKAANAADEAKGKSTNETNLNNLSKCRKLITPARDKAKSACNEKHWL